MRLIALLAVMALATLSHPAHADAVADAKVAFDAGLAAEKRGDWTAAATYYENAYNLKPHPFALFNIARAHERAGHARTASRYYTLYLDTAKEAPDRDEVERALARLQGLPSDLSITTNPANAQISVDGVARGVSPVTVRLSGGEHQVVATLGTRIATRDVSLGFGEPVTVDIDVHSRPARLIVSSNVEGAIVFVDDKPAGVVPLRADITSGHRTITVASPGYLYGVQEVELAPGGSSSLRFTLQRAPISGSSPANVIDESTVVVPPTSSQKRQATWTFGLLSGYALDSAKVDPTSTTPVEAPAWSAMVAFGVVRNRKEVAGIIGKHLGLWCYAVRATGYLSAKKLAPLVDAGAGYCGGRVGNSSASAGYMLQLDGGVALRNPLELGSYRMDVRLTVGIVALSYGTSYLARFPVGLSLVFQPK